MGMENKFEKNIGMDCRIALIDEIILDTELEAFIDEANTISETGGKIAICDSGTNFAELVIMLVRNGFISEYVEDLENEKRAVIFRG